MDSVKVPLGYGPELIQSGTALAHYEARNDREEMDLPRQVKEALDREEAERQAMNLGPEL